MKLLSNKIFLIGLVLILILSTVWDLYIIVNHRNTKKQISNYITFEGSVLESKREELIQQIQTSIAFKSDDHRMRFKAFDNLENQNANTLEKNILAISYFPDINSIPNFTNSFENGLECLNLKSIQLTTYCNKLHMNGLLEALNQEAFDDSDGGFYTTRLKRPITEDSVYIGSVARRDGRSKFAFRINDQLFSDEYTGQYIVPKTDTLRLETIAMRNIWIKIDTSIHRQTIAYENNKWRKISGD